MRAPFSLRGKMLAFTVGVVAVLGGLSLAVVHYFVARQANAEVVEDLARTKSVFEKFMAERALWLRSACLVVAEDPRFTAPLDIHSPELDFQARTVLREARRFQGIIGGDHFLVTDGKGRVLARIDVLAEPGGTVLDAPTVARALRGEAATGRWMREGIDYQVATAPVRDGPQVAGTLTVGFAEALAEADLMEALHAAETFHDVRQALAPDRPADAASLALQIQRDLDADVVALTDAAGIGRGVVVRRAGWGGVVSDPRVLEALEGREFVGLRTEGERIAQMVVVPVWSRGQVIGTLATGFEIDDRLARDLAAMTRSDVSFAVGGRVVASTWPEAVRRDVERALAGNPATGERPFEMALGDETYLSLLGRLTLPEASPGGIYLMQRSLDQAVGFLTTMQQVLLFIGAGVLVAAGVISYAGVARIVQPVRALVEGTRLVAAGNLAHRISASSRDEIGELAGAFNEMAAALATSRDTLAESERRYRDLFDHAQDVVYTTDLEMRLTSVNEAGLERLGYPADELVGRSFYDLLTTAEAARIAAEDRRLPPGAPRPAFEAVVRRKDGTEATLEFVSRWIIEGGQPVGVHGIGRDISERRDREQATNRFREQMHQAEKLRALGEMAAGVAHNFNNLLQGVMGYAELMESRARTTEAYQRYARKVVASAQQCAAIVKRIQTFGRPTDIARKDQVDLSRVAGDTVELTRPKWKSGPEREGRSIEVVLELEDVPAIESSGAAWEEIISNLVFNGVDAMPDGGTLTVATREEDGECVLEVRDTGTGMDEETQRRIFEPFFTTKGPELGTGLGLSTVWGLVQGHGGRIEVDSAPGRGTTFTIRVRPAAEPAPPPLPERAVRADVSALQILIVDDEPSVRELLAEMLSGHAVDAVGSGADALERFGDGRYDAVISDWSMAGLSGLEVAAEVKRRAPETVTVLMTGWEVSGSAAARSPDVDLLLQKPITMRELDRIVGEAIDLRARNREGRPA